MNNFGINLLLSEIGESDDIDTIRNLIFFSIGQSIENNEEVLQLLGLLKNTLRDQIRNENYLMTIQNYFSDDFIQHFRMPRTVMQQLIQEIGNLKPSLTNINKKLLFTVWMLAKPESYKACCDRFDIPQGSGFLFFYEMCSLINNLMAEEVKWPTQQELVQISNAFQTKTNFPGIIGAIDGCHIPIKAPPHNPVDYYNRKGFHSVILQAVCDDKMLFRDIFIGMPGRMHDARVFRSSPLYLKIIGQPPLIDEQQHLLGDSAYPLMNNLLVPFRDNGHLMPIQTHFNEVLSTSRSKIEQAFGRLKNKFQRLKYLDANVENVPKIISASCILHNFILRRTNFDVVYDDIQMPFQFQENEIQDHNRNEDPRGVLKRNRIMEILHQ